MRSDYWKRKLVMTLERLSIVIGVKEVVVVFLVGTYTCLAIERHFFK